MGTEAATAAERETLTRSRDQRRLRPLNCSPACSPARSPAVPNFVCVLPLLLLVVVVC